MTERDQGGICVIEERKLELYLNVSYSFFPHPLNKYLLSICCIPEVELGA